MKKGNIGVTTQDIFPVIKKFLYSDHEIFLREMVSNAIDATQKLKTLAEHGTFKGEQGDLTVRVILDEKKKTLTFSDRGIGMTEEEVEKYINQIAFSGVNDFLEKYKENAHAIIGHFGLGFYSAFMVSKKVEIITRSWQDDAEAVKWTCDGTPQYSIGKADKTDRGTDIILHIDDDSKEFLERQKVQQLLDKYCKFMPVPIAFGKKQEWKDGKMVDTDDDNIVNSEAPLWTSQPASLTDDDYKKFYRTLYPMQMDEPMFWIHLNVDFPFHLTGILYFPKIHSNVDLQRNKIQLYCNQVYVTDQVEGIVPEFLTLLHGVIDSPDIPLNVSRSYLQSDANVKKIATYITKKVADKLNSLFKDNRKEYEEKWDALKLFIHYGMLSQDDFYDRARQFALFKDVDGKFYSYDEYRQLIEANQTDKDGTLVYLYANDREAQYPYISAAQTKGYSVLLLDGELDTHLIAMLEQKMEKTRFQRVDADIVERLIPKDDNAHAGNDANVDDEQRETLQEAFRSQLPAMDKAQVFVEAKALDEQQPPVVITQSEYMRRMKDISRLQSGMNFYAQMPDTYQMTLNTQHPIIRQVIENQQEECIPQTKDITRQINSLKAQQQALRQVQDKKKADEITDEERNTLKEVDQQLQAQEAQRKVIIRQYADGNPTIRQLIDLALLQNGMLKGEALNNFVTRSWQLLQ